MHLRTKGYVKSGGLTACIKDVSKEKDYSIGRSYQVVNTLAVYILHCPDNLLPHSTGVITVPHQSCFITTEILNTYVHLYALLYAAVYKDATIVMTYNMSYRIHNSVILIEINCFML